MCSARRSSGIEIELSRVSLASPERINHDAMVTISSGVFKWVIIGVE